MRSRRFLRQIVFDFSLEFRREKSLAGHAFKENFLRRIIIVYHLSSSRIRYSVRSIRYYGYTSCMLERLKRVAIINQSDTILLLVGKRTSGIFRSLAIGKEGVEGKSAIREKVKGLSIFDSFVGSRDNVERISGANRKKFMSQNLNSFRGTREGVGYLHRIKSDNPFVLRRQIYAESEILHTLERFKFEERFREMFAGISRYQNSHGITRRRGAHHLQFSKPKDHRWLWKYFPKRVFLFYASFIETRQELIRSDALLVLL